MPRLVVPMRGRRAVGLAHRFQLAVQRQDQRRVFGDAQIVRRHR